MKKIIYCCALLLGSLMGCKESETERITNLVKLWQGRTLYFPVEAELSSFRGDSIYKYSLKPADYCIVTYVDSIGCMSCKLQLPEWKKLIVTIDSVSGGTVPCLFFFHPSNKKELVSLLKRVHFTYPVCIDETDSLNKLNHFPADMMFQTFLVDKYKKVLAIGNPVHNPQVKQLYLDIISGKQIGPKKQELITQVEVSSMQLGFGSFDWQEAQTTIFSLRNTGKYPLVIQDITTSCGCTSVEYSKEPVASGKSLDITVTYKADHPEHFNKTISVYCNATASPMQLKIMGEAR